MQAGGASADGEILARMGCRQQASLQNVKMFCGGLESDVSASTDQIALTNGSVVRCSLRAEYDNGLHVAVDRDVVWIPRRQIRSVERGVDRHDVVPAPILWALKVSGR